MVNKTIYYPKFCFGCEALGGKDWGSFDLPALKKVVTESVDLGVKFYDVADCYGLGMAEKNLASALGSKRHDVIIASKGGVRWKKSFGRAKTWIDLAPSYIERAFYNSLRRLRLDYIPIYFLHYPSDIDNFISALNLLSALKKKNLIQSLGLSNVTSAQLELAIKYVKVDIIQIPVNILNSPLSEKIQSICRDNNIHVMAFNTLASGLLTGKYNIDTIFFRNDRRSRNADFKGELFKTNIDKVEVLTELANCRNLGLVEFSIKQLFDSYPEVTSAIIGIKTREQLLHNMEIFS